MKNLIRTTIIIMLSTVFGFAQNINWQSLEEDKSGLVYLNFGYDFGMSTQVGIGHKIETFLPIVLTADYSFPAGKNIADDFKIRLGGQLQLFEYKNFVFSTKLLGTFKRHETDLVRMASFGSDFSAIAGFYKAKWHVAAEVGFDKTISNNLKHSKFLRDNYPDIKDGWYIPTGGNWYYGVQGSKTFGNRLEGSIRIGVTNAEKKDENALLPYYTQLGLVWRY